VTNIAGGFSSLYALVQDYQYICLYFQSVSSFSFSPFALRCWKSFIAIVQLSRWRTHSQQRQISSAINNRSNTSSWPRVVDEDR